MEYVHSASNVSKCLHNNTLRAFSMRNLDQRARTGRSRTRACPCVHMASRVGQAGWPDRGQVTRRYRTSLSAATDPYGVLSRAPVLLFCYAQIAVGVEVRRGNPFLRAFTRNLRSTTASRGGPSSRRVMMMTLDSPLPVSITSLRQGSLPSSAGRYTKPGNDCSIAETWRLGRSSLSHQFV
jgi:hypothetical protein